MTVLGRGDTKMSIRLGHGLQIDLRIVPAESFGAALQYFTGSKEHNVVLRGMAKDRGLRINEYGVFYKRRSAESEAESTGQRADKESVQRREYIAGRTEEEVYATLDLPGFRPSCAKTAGEFAWAAAGKLPKLIELTDIQGDLHMHTTASDGKATLEK